MEKKNWPFLVRRSESQCSIKCHRSEYLVIDQWKRFEVKKKKKKIQLIKMICSSSFEVIARTSLEKSEFLLERRPAKDDLL